VGTFYDNDAALDHARSLSRSLAGSTSGSQDRRARGKMTLLAGTAEGEEEEAGAATGAGHVQGDGVRKEEAAPAGVQGPSDATVLDEGAQQQMATMLTALKENVQEQEGGAVAYWVPPPPMRLFKVSWLSIPEKVDGATTFCVGASCYRGSWTLRRVSVWDARRDGALHRERLTA
jgi:hypothetical protein